jgi:DNA replication and repair protein RecF
VVDLVYESAWVRDDSESLETALSDALVENRRRDLDRGSTSVGPQRDDVRVVLDDRDARTQASQGEVRSLALALRLASHTVVQELVGDDPVVLLDDVFSELDPRRAAALADALPRAQTLVTSAIGVPPGLPVDHVIEVDRERLR